MHLDAHADLYPDFEGNWHSHASPFARVWDCPSNSEPGSFPLCRRLISIGVRAVNAPQQTCVGVVVVVVAVVVVVVVVAMVVAAAGGGEGGAVV